MWSLVLLSLCLFNIVLGQQQHRSCMEIYKSDPTVQNGTYTLYNSHQQSYQVYCEFHHGYGYTFLSPATHVNVNTANLYTDNSSVLFRILRKDGSQWESVLSNIHQYAKYKLSFQYNSHAGYAAPLNTNMAPYLFVGFLPLSVARNRNTQGYNANGHDYTFTNCDSNPNSYIAFHFNQKNLPQTDYFKHCCDTAIIHHMVDTSHRLPTAALLPANFYSFFETHWGGCGGYGVPQEYRDVQSAAAGLKWVVTCRDPQATPQTTITKGHNANAVGGQITYACAHGLVMTSGDRIRTCLPSGLYSGVAPSCATPNPCDSSPCQNQGTCFYQGGSSFICECAENFLGAYCQTASG